MNMLTYIVAARATWLLYEFTAKTLTVCFPINLTHAPTLMSGEAQATCSPLFRDIHFLSVCEEFMNYKSVTARDPGNKWGGDKRGRMR